MAGYIGSKSSVTQVDGYSEAEADAEFVTKTGDTMSGGLTVGGNILVGKTAFDDGATKGFTHYSGGGDSATFSTRSNNPPLNLNRLNSDGEILRIRKDGTTVGSLGVVSNDNLFWAGAAGNTKGLYLADQGVIPCITGGTPSDATSDLGAPTVRFRHAYLSGGIYLGGAGSANLLDHYEEGNWTPVGSNFTISSITHATYVKIGKSVTILCWVNALNTSGGAGTAAITGLPFTSTTYVTGTANISTANSALNRLHTRVGSGTSYIQFIKNNDEGVAGSFVDAGHIIISATYETNS